MPVTYLIIGITVIISVLAFSNKEMFYKLELSPYQVTNRKEWYRTFTHGFIHVDFIHLLINMYVLYMFGTLVENFFGQLFGMKSKLYYLLLYLGGMNFAALPSLKKHKNNPYYRAVGASGAVSAVLFSAILFIPTAPLRIMFIPIDIPAFIFGILYLALEYYLNKKANDNIAHDAHYWGALFGIVFTLIISPSTGLMFLQKVGVFLGIG
ncbi:MAG: rhomboid family intramembrane serine protease [Bacteroidetes bacterium]|nr:MAG: rhomboid family intramembrane serine protease [Bacteroidota bacterium]